LKKIFIIIIFFSFHFISPSQADDIRDFEIEGISLGDSLLDHYKLDIIKKREIDKITYPDSNYSAIAFKLDGSNFESLQVTYNNLDPKYKIISIAGRILYEKKDINVCKKKMKEILNDIKNSFKDIIIKQNKDKPYKVDTLGKSVTHGYTFYLDRGAVDLYCMDLSDEYRKASGSFDELRISLHSHEMREYLTE
tara:strand:+ start:281 stop:862 length:582 start_codon:yes stop_codon:yes gene_type:complete